MTHHLSILLWIPGAAALAIGLLDLRRARVVRGLAIASTLLTALLAMPLWVTYQPRGAEWQLVERVNWLPALGASYALAIDGHGLVLVLLTAILGVVASLSLGSLSAERAKSSYGAALCLQFALLGVFMSLDLLLWLAFVLIALAVSAFVVRNAGATGRSAAWLWPSTSAAGALLLAGVLFLYFSHHALSGVYSFDLAMLQRAAIPPSTQIRAFVALFLGFAFAVGVIVFQQTRIDAQPTAAPVALICAALLLEVAAFALIRIGLRVLPDASRALAFGIMALAITGAIAAAILALTPTGWKRLAAYATASQIGVAIAAACALTPDGITGSMLAASVPPFGGFAGARLVLDGIWQVSAPLAVLTAATLLFISVAVVKMCWRRTMLRDRATEGPSVGEALTMASLFVIALGIGLHPAPLSWRVETSVARAVLRVSPQYAPDVADCLSQPPPTPADTGLPPGVVMSAPCADGSSQPTDPHKK